MFDSFSFYGTWTHQHISAYTKITEKFAKRMWCSEITWLWVTVFVRVFYLFTAEMQNIEIFYKMQCIRKWICRFGVCDTLHATKFPLSQSCYFSEIVMHALYILSSMFFPSSVKCIKNHKKRKKNPTLSYCIFSMLVTRTKWKKNHQMNESAFDDCFFVFCWVRFRSKCSSFFSQQSERFFS